MKLLFISGTLPPKSSPEGIHTAMLCRHFAAQGIDVHLLTTKQEGIPTDLPCAVYPIMEKWDWSEMPRLARFIRRCKPDAVLLMYLGFMYGNEAMVTFAPTVCKRLLPRRVKFIAQFENFMGADTKTKFSNDFRRFLTRLQGREGVSREFGTLLKDSDHLIFLSRNHFDQAKEHFDVTYQHVPIEAKSSVIPAPPVMERIAPDPARARAEERAKLGLEPDAPLILYFGFLYLGKGIDTLVRAFHQLSARFDKAKLIIVGGVVDYSDPALNEPVRMFHALPKELGIEAKVIWTGFLDSSTDLASRYMYAADLCVLPFDFGVQLNNSSLAVVMNHNLPVISTRGEHLEPEFKHKENIYLCPPKEPAILASAMEEVLTDTGLYDQLVGGAQQMSRELFSWEEAVKRTIALF